MDKTDLHAYISPVAALLDRFARNGMSAEEFQVEFFPQFAQLPGTPADDVGLVAERYFQAVEDWDADERLSEPGALSTSELRTVTGQFLELAGFGSRASAG